MIIIRNISTLAAAATTYIYITACAFIEFEKKNNRLISRSYISLIFYNPLNNFSLIDLNDIFCYYLMRFTK